MRAFLKPTPFITWTIVTFFAWTIAAMIQGSSDNGYFWVTQVLTSPISIAIVGMMQSLLLWNRSHLRNNWLKMIAVQIAVSIGFQLVILMLGFFHVLMTIATLGKSGVWSGFCDAITIVLLLLGIVSNGLVQGWGLRQAWCDRPMTCYPHCRLPYARII
jgi:hypothetical protein